MEAGYDKVALQEYMDQICSVEGEIHRLQDESLNLYNSCKQQYNRIHTKLEEVAHRAYNQLENSESMQRSAELEYEIARQAAENAEDEDRKNTAIQKMHQAQIRKAEADRECLKAAAVYSKASEDIKNLSALWERDAPTLETQVHRIEDNMASFSRLVANGNSDISEYMSIMDKAGATLYGSASNDSNMSASASAGVTSNASARQGTKEGISDSASSTASQTATSGSGRQFDGIPVRVAVPIGWCTSNNIRAVSVDENGHKVVSMTIGGIERNYTCSMSGMAKAYRHAKASGDQDMIARTSAMFEIETLREDLELGNGDAAFTQLGGYHKDVKNQDPAGYESHHIPSRTTQDADDEMLPTISITHDDHVLTSSYAWKQNKTYHPIFPTKIPVTNYKESIIQNLEQGSSGYVDSVKHELLDLRSTTGHRYDGGISAYLDAVIDMLSTRGIPKAKSGGGQ